MNSSVREKNQDLHLPNIVIQNYIFLVILLYSIVKFNRFISIVEAFQKFAIILEAVWAMNCKFLSMHDILSKHFLFTKSITNLSKMVNKKNRRKSFWYFALVFIFQKTSYATKMAIIIAFKIDIKISYSSKDIKMAQANMKK